MRAGCGPWATSCAPLRMLAFEITVNVALIQVNDSAILSIQWRFCSVSTIFIDEHATVATTNPADHQKNIILIVIIAVGVLLILVCACCGFAFYRSVQVKPSFKILHCIEHAPVYRSHEHLRQGIYLISRVLCDSGSELIIWVTV